MTPARIVLQCCAPALMLLAAACAEPQRAGLADEAAGSAPAWPAFPEQARVRYVRSVTGPRDWGITRSFWRRTLDALAGRSEELFVRPSGVAADDGVLYVTDLGAQAVWILDTKRDRAVKVTEVGSEDLASPAAVAKGPDGSLFVSDTVLDKVFLLDPNGHLQRVAASRGLQRPAGLAYDAAARELYVADAAANQVDVFDPDGALLRSWGREGSRDGEFNHPTHLCLDSSGTLMVTDALNFRIQAFDRQGHFLWKQGHQGDGSGDLAAPKGLATDAEGHVFVVDALFDAVQIFARDGSFLLAFGERGTRAGQFSLPAGLYIDTDRKIYVADAYNRRVQVFVGVPEAPGRSER